MAQAIAYTHSGHSASQLYGFASLFLIGFFVAAMGGAGTALPAVLDRERLTEFFAPLTAVFITWLAQAEGQNHPGRPPSRNSKQRQLCFEHGWVPIKLVPRQVRLKLIRWRFGLEG
jgi:hypothetical protein